jgi:hypothetical protein
VSSSPSSTGFLSMHISLRWDTRTVRCQGPNGPGGPLGLGLGIRLSPCLGVK